MLNNKHVVVAFIVAPLLAIVSYLATDTLVSEKPSAALPGHAYPLVAQSNCRYERGRCTLVNGDVRIELRAHARQSPIVSVFLESNLPATNARISIADRTEDASPKVMSQTDNNGTQWRTALENTAVNGLRLRLAVSIAGSMYYAETDMVFAQ